MTGNITMTAPAKGLDLNFADPANLADGPFFKALAEIRERDPVFWSDFQGGWLFTRYEDVRAGFSDPRLSAKRLHINQFRSISEAERAALIPNMIRYVPDWIINVDGEQHARLRRLVTKAFSRRIVENLRPQVQALVAEILNDIEAKGEVEFIEEVAFRLPATVIMRLLGVPDEHYHKLGRWAQDVTYALASQNPPRELLISAEQCFVEMNEVFGAEFEKRKINPTPDLMTELMLARDEKDALTEDELIGMCHVLLIAGHDTTANSLGLGLVALLKNPEHRAAYMANPQEGMRYVAELLRYVAMSSTQIRVVAEPMEVGGKQLSPGQIVFLMLAGANRDPSVYENPDEINFDRDLNGSMTFGPGIHHCVGHILARMELDVFFRAFFTRFNKVEMLTDNLTYTPNYAFRGLEQLPVKFAKA
jgi:cytochrome P450